MRSSVALVLVFACVATALAQPFRLDRDDFPHTRFPAGRFGDPHLVIYDDGVVLATASYRYSQRRHDSRWVVVALEIAASEALTVRPEDIALVRPDGAAAPAATGSERRRDPEGLRRLVRERARWPDTLTFAFPRDRIDRGFHRFDFGMDESDRAPDRVLRIGAGAGVRGDVFFAAPDGRWRAGVHALVVTVDDERVVRLPVVLR